MLHRLPWSTPSGANRARSSGVGTVRQVQRVQPETVKNLKQILCRMSQTNVQIITADLHVAGLGARGRSGKNMERDGLSHFGVLLSAKLVLKLAPLVQARAHRRRCSTEDRPLPTAVRSSTRRSHPVPEALLINATATSTSQRRASMLAACSARPQVHDRTTTRDHNRCGQTRLCSCSCSTV